MDSRIADDMKHGDFEGLAANYSRYRPGYSSTVLEALVAMGSAPLAEMDVADVGAGTGIFSRLLAARGPRSVVAIEPNAEMRNFGMRDSEGTAIRWLDGCGEDTGLPDASVDLVTAASCLHWMDFDASVQEFHRVLKTGGRFVAIWNPRYIEADSFLAEIENRLYELAPDIKRVSSGASSFTETLSDRLWDSRCFEDVVYVEGRHVKHFTPAEYVGVWKSVNDVQYQAGPERFGQFLDFVRARTEGMGTIEAHYRTVAWSARRKE